MTYHLAYVSSVSESALHNGGGDEEQEYFDILSLNILKSVATHRHNLHVHYKTCGMCRLTKSAILHYFPDNVSSLLYFGKCIENLSVRSIVAACFFPLFSRDARCNL